MKRSSKDHKGVSWVKFIQMVFGRTWLQIALKDIDDLSCQEAKEIFHNKMVDSRIEQQEIEEVVIKMSIR